MRLHYIFLLLSATAILFASCEEPVDFGVDEKATLVVISNFSEHNDLEVYVSKSKSVLSNGPTEYVEDATVMVFSGSKLIEVLEFVPATEGDNTPPHYRTINLRPDVGEVYTITVQATGFEKVTARNNIPKAVPIQSIEFNNTLEENPNHDVLVNFNVAVTVKDPAGVDNFYHLVFYQQLFPFSLNEAGDTLMGKMNLSTPIEVYATGPSQPLQKYFDKRSFLLKDNQLDGEEITLNFSGSYFFSPEKYIPGQFLVELRTVSEDYFLYYTTLNNQIESSKNPLSNGVVVWNNIENGTGIFAGFSSAFNYLNLQD